MLVPDTTGLLLEGPSLESLGLSGINEAPVHNEPRQDAPDTAASPRPTCHVCNRSYGRPSELHRHMREHNPNATRHSCPFEGCDRKGSKGFTRADKLRAHQHARGHY